MVILGVGADICEAKSLSKMRFTRRFGEYFLTERERLALPSDLHRRRQFIASRFAAKEAVIKAFPAKLTPLEFEIRKKGVKPTVYFLSPHNRRTYQALVSLSHTEDYALGYAVVCHRP
jgi:holo-[acyl-carrier-protein] synthase